MTLLGPGVGATDLVYALAMACPDDFLPSQQGTDEQEDIEEQVLQAYHKALSMHAAENGCVVDYSMDQLRLDFGAGMLDFMRWAFCARSVLGYLWISAPLFPLPIPLSIHSTQLYSTLL
jgi:hypothetical protein